jgi:predicted metal-binding protein
VISAIRDHEDALELANATDYGLSSGVITNNMQKALDLAFGLESGTVHLNDCTVSDEPQCHLVEVDTAARRSLLDGGDDRAQVDHGVTRAAHVSDLMGCDRLRASLMVIPHHPVVGQCELLPRHPL